MEENLRKAKNVFADAMDLPEEDRDRFVNKACGEDEDLKRTVRSLLESASEAPKTFLQPDEEHHALLSSARRASEQPVHIPPGTQLGPYRIESVLGEGGMAVVYRAKQDRPVKREVALKVIKPGMDSAAVIKRFNAERDVLALMTHPNIARVLDAGLTERGDPYFAMELVDGLPVTVFCDEHNLDLNSRLRLFLQVCRAIQHAHSKGIIHRDIKPSNVIVVEESDEPLAKVIDFGVAKAIDSGVYEGGGITLDGQLLGTPEYMCPEQADPAIRDIDTRCDVYSAGMLLYVILAGSLPFPRTAFEGLGHTQIRDVLLKHEPVRPSTRMRDSMECTAIANARGTTPAVLARQLRGELDWVVMKALQKDREYRYPSMTEFAQDVERFLDDMPVLARPPNHLYSCRKFIKRHRFETVACMLIAIALAVSTGTLWVRYSRATQLAAKTNTFDTLLRGILTAPATHTRSRDMTVAELLADASGKVSALENDQPEIAAELRLTLGRGYLSLGMIDQATSEFTSGLRCVENELAPNHQTARDLNAALTELDAAQTN